MRGRTVLPNWTPLGESAVVIEFGNRIDRLILRQVWAVARELQERPLPGVLECVPAYATLTVFFDLMVTDGAAVGSRILERLPHLDTSGVERMRTMEIPVCYGEDFGPDLEFVAQYNGLTPEAVVEFHSQAEYLVYLIGFAPGFPYLGEMSPRIAAPRLATPRLAVPAGSVAIAGQQTGIYPQSTPGGWRLIGRTPQGLFHPDRNPPTLLQAGDAVRFRPIDREEFVARSKASCWEDWAWRSS